MKKLLLFSVFLVAIACSKEDEASEQTFLEKYDGFVFERIVAPMPHKELNFFYNSEVFMRPVYMQTPDHFGCDIAVEGITPSNKCSTIMWCS